MMRAFRLGLMLLGLALLAVLPAAATVRLPGVISEHMVLQRGVNVRLWGWADDGEKVTVRFQGQEVSVTAAGGKWEVVLTPLQPGGPFPLTIAGANTIAFTDILVGDVWISCGQSNMMMGLGSVENGAQAIADSTKYPQIRLCNVPGQQAAPAPQEDIKCAWAQANPGTVGGFSAVSYFFGRALNRHLNVPIGLINAVSIMPAEAWVDEETLLAVPALREMPQRPIKPITTFNAMIAPLTKFTIKGAIYYQGEYNAGRGREFRQLMPALIRSWRKWWGQGDFPFLMVQLTAFYQHMAEKDKKMDMPDSVLASFHTLGEQSAWAELREAQLLTWQSVPNTGMAVTIDIGDPQDIHPKKKEPIGERLALAARAVAYGEKIEYSGPIFDSLATEGSKVILTFTHTGGGLTAQGGELKGFEIAGPDQRFVWAHAEIKGKTIALSHPEVTAPAMVRYAWANYPVANFFNAEGLPASPFRGVIPGKAFQVDAFTIPFSNSDFKDADADPEKPRAWGVSGGAKRVAGKDGAWMMALPPKAGIVQDGIASSGIYGYDWNSDLLEPNHFRPGTIAGYTVEIAAEGAGAQTGYMRLCVNSSATGYQYWGGIPEISTASAQPVARAIAVRMSTKFDIAGNGAGVGTLFAHMGGEGTLYLGNLTAITFVRPRLSVNDVSPIDFGKVGKNTPKDSTARAISNDQARTLPVKLTDADQERQVATVLYGVADIQPGLSWGFEHYFGDTDHVGAVILGKDAGLFAFVSPNTGANPQQLKLVGQDGQPGLLGGPKPESEALVVRFLGSANAGTYTATVRIITQAGNTGIRSTGKAGEPAADLFYVDIPVRVTVN